MEEKDLEGKDLEGKEKKGGAHILFGPPVGFNFFGKRKIDGASDIQTQCCPSPLSHPFLTNMSSSDVLLSCMLTHEIDTGIYDIFLKYLGKNAAKYAAIMDRNEMVRQIAADVRREIDVDYHDQVSTVFASAGPVHDALQDYLDAWLDAADDAAAL